MIVPRIPRLQEIFGKEWLLDCIFKKKMMKGPARQFVW